MWIHQSSHHGELISVSASLLYVTTVIKRGDKTKPKDSPQIHAIYLETAKVLPIHAKPPPVAPTKAPFISAFSNFTLSSLVSFHKNRFCQNRPKST